MACSSFRILDVGCGPGIYVTALRNAGFLADGVDPDPKSPFDHVSVLDDEFSARYSDYDLCLCLEVAEHLPESSADTLIKRLVHAAPVIIFSAAVPGQGGHGHINCQPKTYWEQKFAAFNYVLDGDLTGDFVSFLLGGYHLGWLVNNVQIFRRYGDTCYEQIVREETPQAQRIADYMPRFFELIAR